MSASGWDSVLRALLRMRGDPAFMQRARHIVATAPLGLHVRELSDDEVLRQLALRVRPSGAPGGGAPSGAPLQKPVAKQTTAKKKTSKRLGKNTAKEDALQHDFWIRVVDAERDDEPVHSVMLKINDPDDRVFIYHTDTDGTVHLPNVGATPKDITCDMGLEGLAQRRGPVEFKDNFLRVLSGPAPRSRDKPLPEGPHNLVMVTEHRVRNEETLSGIADHHGVALSKLLKFNFDLRGEDNDVAAPTAALHQALAGIGVRLREPQADLLHDPADGSGILYVPEIYESKNLAIDTKDHVVRVARFEPVERPVIVEQLMRCSHGEIRRDFIAMHSAGESKYGTQDRQCFHVVPTPSILSRNYEHLESVSLHYMNTEAWAPEELELVGPGGESQSVKRIRREGAHWVYELLVPRIGAKPGPVFAKAADPLSAPAEELSRHLKVAFPDFFAHVGAFSIPPQMYTVKGLAKELAIAVHYPHQWKLTVSLPPFRSYKAGYAMSKNRKRSKNETQPKDLDQRHKDATEVSFELDGWKIKNNYLRDGRVETIREKEESTSYRSSAHSALVAQAGLVMGDRGYELDYAKASEEDPIAITLNKVLVDCNPVKTVGQVVSTASKLADLITSIKEHVPKVGWYIDFEHKLFEGELSVEWGFKEHSDERVYPWLRFNIGMVFFAASIEVGIGVSWGSCRAQLFFKVAGQLGLEASGERVSPDGETGVSLGPLAAEFTTTLGVRLEAGHMLELNARGETGLLAEVTLHFNKNERAVSVDGQLSWKGLTVTATVSVCYGAWTKTVIKPLLDPRNLDFSLPNDDDYQAERIDDAEIQKIISDALTRGWNIEVDDIPMATTSAAIRERIVTHHPQIRRDRDSIRALAIDIDNRLSDMTDWGNDLTKQQFLDFVRRGELDQMCKEMYDPVLSFIATHKK